MDISRWFHYRTSANKESRPRRGAVSGCGHEPNKAGDPFEVSDAATMLAYINPKARKPDQVAILTRDGCQYCAQVHRGKRPKNAK